MSRSSTASFKQQMSDLVPLTIEQGRYDVLIFFKLDLSASYAGHATFWFAFVQNLQSAQQVECILVVSVQHQQCRSCLGYMRQPKYQYVCMQTFLCCVCVCTLGPLQKGLGSPKLSQQKKLGQQPQGYPAAYLTQLLSPCSRKQAKVVPITVSGQTYCQSA